MKSFKKKIRLFWVIFKTNVVVTFFMLERGEAQLLSAPMLSVM